MSEGVIEVDLVTTAAAFTLDTEPVMIALVDQPVQVVLEQPPVTEIVLATLGEQGPPGPAGGSTTRRTAHLTTASLAPGASEQTTLTLSPLAQVYRVTTDKPCRVRLYTSSAKQAADLARPINIDPVGDHGVALELLFDTGVLSIDLSPVTTIVDLKTTPDGIVPVTITNTDATPGLANLIFTYIEVE